MHTDEINPHNIEKKTIAEGSVEIESIDETDSSISSKRTSTKTRMHFIDNIRIYLTVLVILHHTSLAYGGAGSWGIVDSPIDQLSSILLTLFCAINQSYFMSAFFLLAGYFTPRSLEKKGSKQFFIDRLIRLGVPILIYTTIIININYYILNVIAKGKSYRAIIEYDPGHLWFLQSLLVFAVIYLIVIGFQKSLKSDFSYEISNERKRNYLNAFPPDRVLLLSIAILTVLTFAVRLVFPVGATILNAQPAHFVHYIFCFCVGILAYKWNWLERVPSAQGRRWGLLSLMAIPLFFVLVVLGGVLENEANIEKFIGGFHWQAFSYALWETFLMIGIITFMLYFFREKLNRSSPFIERIAASVFSVYIIHQTVLFAIQATMLRVSIPTAAKFFIVSIIAIPFCFILAAYIRKIPHMKRVLE